MGRNLDIYGLRDHLEAPRELPAWEADAGHHGPLYVGSPVASHRDARNGHGRAGLIRAQRRPELWACRGLCRPREDPKQAGKESTIAFIRGRRVVGAPDMDRVSTSYVKRMNLTIRTQNRRFARRTNAPSKKLEHYEAHVALLTWWYNFVRIHSSLETTPAVRAGITSEPWTMEQLLEAALSEELTPPLEPKTLRPREDEHRTARQLPSGNSSG